MPPGPPLPFVIPVSQRLEARNPQRNEGEGDNVYIARCQLYRLLAVRVAAAGAAGAGAAAPLPAMGMSVAASLAEAGPSIPQQPAQPSAQPVVEAGGRQGAGSVGYRVLSSNGCTAAVCPSAGMAESHAWTLPAALQACRARSGRRLRGRRLPCSLQSPTRGSRWMQVGGRVCGTFGAGGGGSVCVVVHLHQPCMCWVAA